ncbi:hypothetical protein CDG77_13380 [Nostoc sp. 'Peltigera membranacea cyanobiont' 213]|nr:hypothetical protein CDG77_13380 [Nostoc sp. 'Peltigera membranacea cyanobiont' 213]
MSGKLLVICHCECNEVEGSNRKAFGIPSLRTLLLRRRYANGNAKGEVKILVDGVQRWIHPVKILVNGD